MKLTTGVSLAAAACLGLASTCGISRAQEADLVIDEKPLSHWVKQLRSENRGFQLRAAQALSKVETNQIPKVIPLLLPLLKSERENDRFVAAQTLGNYGPVARVAVPELLPLLKGTQYERNRAASAKALGQILKDTQPGDEVEQVTKELMDAWGDKYEDVRRETVFALGMIGPAAKSSIPRLQERLNDVQPVRNAAAWTCGRMGKLAATHVDRLISIMHGERYPQIDHFFSAAAVEAMGRIGPVQANMVPNIVDRLEAIAAGTAFHPQHDGAAGRVCYLRGVNALERFGPEAASATPYLQRVISSNPLRDRERSLAIVKALGAIGPGAAEAVPALQKIADAKPDGKPDATFTELQQAAAAAIAAIKKPAAAPPK
jgi:HEAT repeat protein